MNLEQWQRSEKIKAEAEAAAKRTVERVLNAVKEPAVSEFKVGDRVVFKSSSLSACVKDVKEVLRCAGDYYLVWRKYGFHVNLLRHATTEEIAIGHRIDNDLGDDFPIESHISPNCQSRDV